MFKLRWYISIGILAYLVFFISNIPASFLVKQFSEPLKQSGIVLEDVSGTIWSGASSVIVSQRRQPLPPVAVSWQFKVWKLLMAQLSLNYQAEGQGFSLSGITSISPSTLSIEDTSGQLSSELVNRFTKEQGVEISGLVELIDLNVNLDYRAKRAEAASGHISWGGGEVSYKQMGHSQTIDFPSVKGEFSEKEGSLGLAISDEKQGKAIVSAEVAPTGWATVVVMKRVLELAGQMRVGEDGDKSVFEVQQKLF